jgi:hypothetical protein
MPPPASTLYFAGLEWTVKDGFSGPGPNRWSRQNVCVDGPGRLHLRLTDEDGVWKTSEIYTREGFGLGTYQFEIIGELDRLDPNVVVGLFAYPSEDTGPDGTKEIDVEFTRWGSPQQPYGNYTVWPVEPGGPPLTVHFEESLSGTHSTHRFTRYHDRVVFESFHGHLTTEQARFQAGTFAVTDPAYISPDPLHVHLDLWLYRGQPPGDGREIEIIISDFTYTPLP